MAIIGKFYWWEKVEHVFISEAKKKRDV